jgi:hypothetical protein
MFWRSWHGRKFSADRLRHANGRCWLAYDVWASDLPEPKSCISGLDGVTVTALNIVGPYGDTIATRLHQQLPQR